MEEWREGGREGDGGRDREEGEMGRGTWIECQPVVNLFDTFFAYLFADLFAVAFAFVFVSF